MLTKIKEPSPKKPYYCDALLFDLDGTLWNAVDSVTLAWNEAVKNAEDVKAEFSVAQIQGIMGLNTKEIGAVLFPSLSPERQGELMADCTAAERRLLPKIGGKLYPKVRSTLQKLKAKYPLFIVSNCDCGYIEAFLSYHQLADCFTAFVSYGDTGKEKDVNISMLIKKYGFSSPFYIGDTAKDWAAAKKAGCGFIHAAYGFGRMEEAVPSLPRFADLPDFMEPKE